MLLPQRLRRLGFRRELFSDGWFWHIQLARQSPEGRAAAMAIGFSGPELAKIADAPVLLQYCERDYSWQGILGGKSMALTFKQASSALSAMEALLTPD